MLIVNKSKKTEFFQFFIDPNNNLLKDAKGKAKGRKLLVNKLDKELKELFSEHPLVICE